MHVHRIKVIGGCSGRHTDSEPPSFFRNCGLCRKDGESRRHGCRKSQCTHFPDKLNSRRVIFPCVSNASSCFSRDILKPPFFLSFLSFAGTVSFVVSKTWEMFSANRPPRTWASSVGSFLKPRRSSGFQGNGMKYGLRLKPPAFRGPGPVTVDNA